MNDHGHWSSKDIERDVEDSRDTIGSTLAELRSRMKPKELANEALAYARKSGGASLLSGVGTKIRNNPVPAALIGAGVAWLIANRSGLNRLLGSDSGDEGAYPQRMDLAAAKAYRPPRHDARREEPEMVVQEDIAPQESDEGWEVELEYEDGSDDALSTRASETLSNTSEALSETSARMSGRARELGNKARETAQRVQERAKSVADEQPLALALAGLAIGALIGAAVRGTPRETELMGSASRDVQARAKEKVQEGLGEASAVAGRTLDAVREEVNARADA